MDNIFATATTLSDAVFRPVYVRFALYVQRARQAARLTMAGLNKNVSLKEGLAAM